MSAVLGRTPSGEYCDAALSPAATPRVYRYTAYVVYWIDPEAHALNSLGAADVAAALRRGDAFVEEIDVDAATDLHAREIAALALARDYEPGGRIVAVEERIGWYL